MSEQIEIFWGYQKKSQNIWKFDPSKEITITRPILDTILTLFEQILRQICLWKWENVKQNILSISALFQIGV